LASPTHRRLGHTTDDERRVDATVGDGAAGVGEQPLRRRTAVARLDALAGRSTNRSATSAAPSSSVNTDSGVAMTIPR